MKSRPVSTLAILLLCGSVDAQIYQCDLDGSRVFSDRPCGDDARLYERIAAVSYVPPDETLPALAESARQFIADRQAHLARDRQRRTPAPVPSPTVTWIQTVDSSPWLHRPFPVPHRPAPFDPGTPPQPPRYSPLNGPILGTRGTEPYRVRLTDPSRGTEHR